MFMELFSIFLLALIGVAALVVIVLAVKLTRFVGKNSDKTVADIEQELKTGLTHIFLAGTYFLILCLVYIIVSVFMR